MDQYRSRLKLSENFERHWSIRISGGKFIWTTIIGPYLFLGKFVWTNGPESSSKVSPYTGIGPWMALPSNATQKQKGFRRRRLPGAFCWEFAKRGAKRIVRFWGGGGDVP